MDDWFKDDRKTEPLLPWEPPEPRPLWRDVLGVVGLGVFLYLLYSWAGLLEGLVKL